VIINVLFSLDLLAETGTPSCANCVGVGWGGRIVIGDKIQKWVGWGGGGRIIIGDKIQKWRQEKKKK